MKHTTSRPYQQRICAHCGVELPKPVLRWPFEPWKPCACDTRFRPVQNSSETACAGRPGRA